MSEIRASDFSWPHVNHCRYNASRGGHAPEYLTDALVEALERTFGITSSWWDGLEIDFNDEAKPAWWPEITNRERARWLMGQLWNCNDLVPWDICSRLDFPPGTSFAQMVRMLKSDLMESDDSFEFCAS
jgi:hypothetical protein